MNKNRIILFVLFLGVCVNLLGQNKSNRGKEFWLGYGYNYKFLNELPLNNQDLAIYISTIQPATVTISINTTGWTQTLNIPANTVDASIIIPKSGPDDARILTDGLSTKGIHIVSNVDVAVYAHCYGTMVSGATMLMPVETYGYTYRSVNYLQNTSSSRLPVQSPTTANGPDWYSWFYVIASEDNTRLEIIPSDSTKNGWLPGQTYTVNLSKGEIYNVFGKLVNGNNALWAASKDMTGSRVTSVLGPDGKCHPFALFSGSSGIRICHGDGGEFVHQQMFPTQAWGTRYLTYHTINNGNTDITETNRNYYRICVNDPATVVKKNGVVMTGLQNNFYYNDMDSVGGNYYEANNPILVSQYTVNDNQCWGNVNGNNVGALSYGDPEMFYLSPLEQGQKNILFYVSRKSAIDYAYSNIIVPTSAVGSLRVDGAALPSSQIITHPNLPSYSVALARYIGPAAQHTITCDSNVIASLYGLGNWESYGYNVGCNINNLNMYGGVTNVFNTNATVDTVTCLNTPVRLFVKIAHLASSIHWKLSQVPGLVPNVDSIVNNPIPIGTEVINGRTYHIYTLQQDFVFTQAITASIPIAYTSVVIPNCFNSENAEMRIGVREGPKADFTFTNPVCLKDSVYLNGIVLATNGFNITQYLWNFADNTTAGTQNTVKKFNTPGTQNVRFRIIADNGCAGDTTKPVTIFDTPIARLGITPASICAKDSILITDTSSINIGTINTYYYDFGDNTNLTRSINTPFYHQYINPGNYTVKLIVSSNNSCKSDTVYKFVTVRPKPIANFGIDRNICVNDSIRLTDASSFTGGIITSYHWNFGDGTTLIRNTNTPFYKQYTASGTYVVSLVVIGNNGCNSDTMKRTVIVSPKPNATISFNGKPCIDSIFNFTSSFPFTVGVRYHWNFGDGQFINNTTANTITHAYTTTGTNIVIKHLVDLGGGCYSDTITTIIPAIFTNPIAQFSIDDDTLCVGTQLKFSSNVNGNYTWNWNFGNGTGNQLPPFNYTYNTAGNFTVSLQLINANGCNSSIVNRPITISENPIVSAGADKFIQTGGNVILDATVSPAGNYNYAWLPVIYLNNAGLLNPIATPPSTLQYVLRVNNTVSNCFGEDSVKVNVIDKLYIPNAFTPNNDGKNDVWTLLGLALYPDAKVIIYNRWGQKVYETKDYHVKPWDGKYKGSIVPEGAYIYFIQLNNLQKEIRKGTILVIR